MVSLTSVKLLVPKRKLWSKETGLDDGATGTVGLTVVNTLTHNLTVVLQLTSGIYKVFYQLYHLEAMKRFFLCNFMAIHDRADIVQYGTGAGLTNQYW